MTPTPLADPSVGEVILWNGLETRVTRLGLPTFPGGPALVYGRVLMEGDDFPEQFVPAGEWSRKSRLAMSDLERAEADLREARDEALRLRRLINDDLIPGLRSVALRAGSMLVDDAVERLVKAAREALEVRP